MAIAAHEKLNVLKTLSPVERKLGEVLFESGTLTEHDIKRVLAAQQERGERFGDVALRLGLVTEHEVRRALARQCEFPYVLPGESRLSTELTAAYRPFNKRSEALRQLRSELMLRWFAQENSMLAVMSARAGQGSSLLAANLAIVFAQLGERTLLIDANMRNPVQHALFGINPTLGLCDYLKGRDCLREALMPVPSFGELLTVLTAGAVPPNPQELLSRVSFNYLMDTVPAGFDVVIVDCPPLLDYADAQIISMRTRGSLLVTKRHETRVSDIERVHAHLQPTGTSLLGVVVDG